MIKTVLLLNYCALLDQHVHSEGHALEYLQRFTVATHVAQQVLTLIQENSSDEVLLELHGFTVRDMCPNCFYSFNICQFAANNNLPIGFWQKIKQRIGQLAEKQKIKVPTTIHTQCWISSVIPFEHAGSQPNFRPDYSINPAVDSINLFRLEDKVFPEADEKLNHLLEEGKQRLAEELKLRKEKGTQLNQKEAINVQWRSLLSAMQQDPTLSKIVKIQWNKIKTAFFGKYQSLQSKSLDEQITDIINTYFKSFTLDQGETEAVKKWLENNITTYFPDIKK